MKKLTDKQRILRLALSRGNRGFTVVDFLAPDVCDGGKPITRVAARVKDLRDEGIEFRDGGRRNACKVYILDRESLAKATLPDPPSPLKGDRPPESSVAPAHTGVQGDTSPPLSPEADGSEGSLFDMPTRGQSLTFEDVCPPPRNAINDDVEAA